MAAARVDDDVPLLFWSGVPDLFGLVVLLVRCSIFTSVWSAWELFISARESALSAWELWPLVSVLPASLVVVVGAIVVLPPRLVLMVVLLPVGFLIV